MPKTSQEEREQTQKVSKNAFKKR